MMLVHKQPSPFLSQQLNPALTHRRHPSAPPTVIVQPTHTPGLLSLSKPTHRSPRTNNKSPRPRQQQPVLMNPVEITDKKTAVRPKKQPKSDKQRQSTPDPSQAEASDSSSDPFSPAFKPSPKFHVPLTIRTQPQAIPLPSVPRPSNRQLSRSEPPALSHSWDHMCDDSNDEGPITPPTTPLRPRAPETPKRKARNHKRAPSDQIFVMSSDDEAFSGSDDLQALLNFVRHGPSRPLSTPARKVPSREYVRSLSPASREKLFELEAQKEVAGYFASSSFQNSPSPDDLPAPLF